MEHDPFFDNLYHEEIAHRDSLAQNCRRANQHVYRKLWVTKVANLRRLSVSVGRPLHDHQHIHVGILIRFAIRIRSEKNDLRWMELCGDPIAKVEDGLSLNHDKMVWTVLPFGNYPCSK